MDYIKSYPNLMKDIFYNISYFLIPNHWGIVSHSPSGTLNKVYKPYSKRISYKSLGRFMQTCKLFRDIGNKRFDEILKIKEKENFYKLCKRGDKIIYYLINRNNFNLNEALLSSVEGYNYEFCKFFIFKGANNFNKCLDNLKNNKRTSLKKFRKIEKLLCKHNKICLHGRRIYEEYNQNTNICKYDLNPNIRWQNAEWENRVQTCIII